MYMYLKMVFIILLFSVVTHESVAQNTVVSRPSFIMSGGPTETARFTFFLQPQHVNDRFNTFSPKDCGLSLTLTTRSVMSDSGEVVEHTVNIHAGDAEELSIEFDQFGAIGTRTLLVQLTRFKRFGTCELLTTYRLTGADVGGIRGISDEPGLWLKALNTIRTD